MWGRGAVQIENLHGDDNEAVRKKTAKIAEFLMWKSTRGRNGLCGGPI